MPRRKKDDENIEQEKDLTELQKAVEKLSKEYSMLDEPEFVRSGSVVMDALLGGGIPQGVFILWSAENGCGKSTGALHISRTYCMQNKKVLYLDYEGGVNNSQINGMGLKKYLYDRDENPNGNFFIYKVQTYKDAESILDKIMDYVDLVVIDSATAILTEKTKDSSSEDILPGIDSRVMSTFLKKYKAEAVRNKVTWIIINQMRTKIAMGWGQVTKDEEAGGHALKFYSDIRIRMVRAYKGVLEREEETATGKQKVPFGAICDIWTAKNRFERPNIPLKLAIIFGKGISNEYAYFDFLESNKAIIKSGAWYSIKLNETQEEVKVQGVGKVIDWINNNKSKVKEYISDMGGYKLLLNQDNTIDINKSELEEDIYGEQIIDSGINIDTSDTSESSNKELLNTDINDD